MNGDGKKPEEVKEVKKNIPKTTDVKKDTVKTDKVSAIVFCDIKNIRPLIKEVVKRHFKDDILMTPEEWKKEFETKGIMQFDNKVYFKK